MGVQTVWVTGGAGFIGSHLVAHQISKGQRVVVIDSLTDYYSDSQKRTNLAAITGPDVSFVEADLTKVDLSSLDVPATVFHLAGQPGVRQSWGAGFGEYVDRNILATERLVEHCTAIGAKLIYASSSSVYGVLAEGVVADETSATLPNNPYGITKLAGELLVRTFSRNYGLASASMRYFTVYGPRQRPDMAIHRLCKAAVEGTAFPLYGDGSQVREFTYVDDVVRATSEAETVADASGPVFNVAGGSTVALRELITLVQDISGSEVKIDHLPIATGDVPATRARIDRIRQSLDWEPQVSLEHGVAEQIRWHQSVSGGPAGQ